jgi:hypothetical protein
MTYPLDILGDHLQLHAELSITLRLLSMLRKRVLFELLHPLVFVFIRYGLGTGVLRRGKGGQQVILLGFVECWVGHVWVSFWQCDVVARFPRRCG